MEQDLEKSAHVAALHIHGFASMLNAVLRSVRCIDSNDTDAFSEHTANFSSTVIQGMQLLWGGTSSSTTIKEVKSYLGDNLWAILYIKQAIILIKFHCYSSFM